jgi:hypothetical protein
MHLTEALDRPRRARLNATRTNPYGDGRASQRCVAAIVDLLDASGVWVSPAPPFGAPATLAPVSPH